MKLNKKLVYCFKICICVLSLFLLSNKAYANGVDNDFAIWNKVNLNVPINDRLKINLDTQYRYQADGHAYDNTFILRPSLGVDLFKGFSLWQGYGYFNYDDTDIFENRIWQQLQHELVLPKVTLVNRFRLEERIFKNIFTSDDVSVRGKYLLRAMFPIWKKKLFFVLSDELAFNFNDAYIGLLSSGYDSNRLFSGLYHKFNDYFSFEAGYQFEHIHIEDFREIFNHGILFNAYLTTPQIFNRNKKPLTVQPPF